MKNQPETASKRQLFALTCGVLLALAPSALAGCGGKPDATMTSAPVTQGNAPPPIPNRDLSHRLPPLAGPRAKGNKGGE